MLRMQPRRSLWWILPVALIALVLFCERATPPPSDAAVAAVDAVARPGLAVLRDASGHRSRPLVLPTETAALVLDLGKQLQQQRVSLRLWQCDAQGVRRQPAWLGATPRVRRDGTLPIAGLLPGSYDVEIELARGGEPPLQGCARGVALAAGALVRRELPLAAAAAPPR